MTVTIQALTAAIDLGASDGCESSPHCEEWAAKLKQQLDPKYSRGASLLPLEYGFAVWQATHRTARKRAARAERLGYRAEIINRSQFVDDIYAINLSAPERQGRPMGPGYQDKPTYGSDEMLCIRHHVATYGVLDSSDKLVAYLWLYRSGDLAMVSSILGHADHLTNNVMYLLFEEMLRWQFMLGGTVFYNLHNSGTDGLRFYKERVGLKPGNVKWALS